MEVPQNLSAQKFYNRHKGNLAIICGSGPSLNNYSWNDFPPDSVIFCVNNSILKFKHPDYWMAVDRAVTQEQCWDNLLGAGTIIATEELHDLWEQDHPRVERLVRDPSLWYMLKGSNALVMGFDVVQSCTHLAIIMGCRAVALIGCDLALVNDEKYFIDNQVGDQTDEGLKRSLEGWKLIREKNPTVPIYNCSPHYFGQELTKAKLSQLTNNF